MSHKNCRPSNHMVVRSQQRGIPEEMVEVLTRFGIRSYTRDRAFTYCMNKKSRERAKVGLGAAKYRELERWMGCFTVISREGQVITLGHRFHHHRA